MERKKWFALILAFVLVFTSVPVYAETGKGGVQAEEVTLTEENQYDPIYFQQPKVRYPQHTARANQAGQASLSLEESVVSQLKQHPDKVDVSAYKIPISEKGEPYFQILNNHPELFYVQKSTAYSYSGGYIISYSVKYQIPKEDIPQYEEALEEEVDLAVAQIDPSLSDLEKALAVHDYLALHCEYDFDRLNSGTLPSISHTAYGALVNRMAVCDGYAGAFAYIMKDRFQVPCIMVSSSQMAHAWNMINIGNEWYHVDVTWDDPVRDLVGRVAHDYFMLSDSVISDSEHEHMGWVSEYEATSAEYSGAFWTDVSSAIIYQQGAWHYSKYHADTRKVNLVKKSSLLGGSETTAYSADLWTVGSSYYPVSFMYLDQANGNIYFNTKNEIRRLGSDGKATVVFQPAIPAGQWIYGFAIQGNQLRYALQDKPNVSGKQDVKTHILPELEPDVLPEVTGVSASDVQAVYDGKAKTVTVVGAQAGDVITYALAGGAYSQSQPRMVDAGTYQVSYRVEREGYKPFTGKASVVIEQAVPVYTAPSGLKGSSGQTLGSITLPEGFVWQTSASTKLSKEGTSTYLVKYVPKDTKNYKQVSDIQVQVTVSCPGHRYQSEVTKEPTTEEAGLRTYTCTLCGHTYTEEIEKLTTPAIAGIKAENVQAVYDGTAKRIEVKGTKTGDVITYALEGGAYSQSQPRMVDAGIYQVSYRVERSGHQPFEGSAVVEILQAVPAFTAPSGLKGSSGQTLGSIALPEGFVWQTAGDTKLSAEGTFSYLVKYAPKDTKNYKEVAGIQVEVEVSCPGHQYTVTVTKEPTATEKGERLYTCKICGYAYTEEIGKLDPSLPQIEGVHAKEVQKTYDGLPAVFTLEGLAKGDHVLYLGEDGKYSETQPEFVDAGDYQVRYRVEREGFQALEGSLGISIGQAHPNCGAPAGLEANVGEALGAVGLPAGFQWQSDASQKFTKEGTFQYLVKYVPEDTRNYKEVHDIKVSVSVSCPGHVYRSVVTRKPTTVQKGIRTYTCTICGSTYTEEIAMLAPQKPGNASGQKVSKATASSLKFTWKKASGVRYELVLSQGKKKAGAKDVSGNSVTFSKLKAGTEYTLKITPYRKVGSQKVYAAKSATVKAATAPAQVKLSSVKKSGSKKAKVTWKKTAGASGYEVYMKVGNGKYKKVKALSSGKKVSHTQSGLKKGKAYSFRVRAYKKVGSTKVYGSYSSVKSIKMK